MQNIKMRFNQVDFTIRYNEETELFSVSDLDRVVTHLYGFYPRRSNDLMKTKKFKTKMEALEMTFVTQRGGKYATRGVWADLDGIKYYALNTHIDFYMFMYSFAETFTPDFNNVQEEIILK